MAGAGGTTDQLLVTRTRQQRPNMLTTLVTNMASVTQASVLRPGDPSGVLHNTAEYHGATSPSTATHSHQLEYERKDTPFQIHGNEIYLDSQETVHISICKVGDRRGVMMV